MSEMGSTTIYIPNSLKRSSSYAAFIDEKNFSLLKVSKQDTSSLLEGPRRVLRLCLFALVLPTILIIIPLYAKLVLYSPGHYPMMPTDQRIISKHVSGIWCKSQSTHMNGSYTTYQSEEKPRLSGEHRRQRYEMLHSTILRDDIKEYWGFHLLKGSKVTVSTCTSGVGAQLMILRGIDNLKRCAWIGEEDSEEEEDEIGGGGEGGMGSVRDSAMTTLTTGLHVVTSTQKPEIHEEETRGSMRSDHLLLKSQEMKPRENSYEEILFENESEERRQNLQDLIQEVMKISKNKKEILRILHSVGKDKHKRIPKKLRQIMGVQSSYERDNRSEIAPQSIKKKNTNRRKMNKSSSEISRLRRSVSEDPEDYNGAFEEFDEEETLDSSNAKTIELEDSVEQMMVQHIFHPEGLKFETGKFNQTNKGDQSNEESQSSYSSSEEALASCEGVILTLPLVSYKSCSYRWMEMNKITYDIPITGTYYFVYSSDNEIDINTIYLNMTFERVVYDVTDSQVVCSNTTNCLVPLSFWSNENTVVEVPIEATWDNNYTLDTTCEPRVAVYLTFLLMVPVLILFCAFQ